MRHIIGVYANTMQYASKATITQSYISNW